MMSIRIYISLLAGSSFLIASTSCAGTPAYQQSLQRVEAPRAWTQEEADAWQEAQKKAEERGRQQALEEITRQKRNYREWETSNQKAAEALDSMAKRVEEYGIITMSAPVLAGPNADFSFHFNRTEAEYFKAAKEEVEAGVGSAERVVQSFSGNLQVSENTIDKLKFKTDQEAYTKHTQAQDELYAVDVTNAKLRYQTAVGQANAETDPVKRQQLLDTARTTYQADLEAATNTRFGDTPPQFPSAAQPSATTQAAQDIATASGNATAAIKAAADSAAATISNAAKTAPGNGSSQTTVNFSGVPAPAVDPNTGLPQANEARGTLQAITNMAALGAVTGVNPKVPDRSALIQTAGNRAVHAIFEFLGDPNSANQFQDKQVLFGVCTVGVSPGWRTQRDFAADVAIQTRYQYEQARYDTIIRLINDRRYPLQDRVALGKPFGIAPSDASEGIVVNHGGAIYVTLGPSSYEQAEDALDLKRPVVSGVSPLMETQVVDLESQWRRQDEFALMLSGLLEGPGYKASGGAFQQYVKNRQSDARSRTSSGVVNTYSAAGGLFGFQVGPRLQALADPATKKAGQGRVLDRQSFPAAILFGLDYNDIRPVIIRTSSGALAVYEPVISLTQTTRWTNISPRFTERFVLWKPSTWGRARWSESDRIRSIRNTKGWYENQDWKVPGDGETGNEVGDQISHLLQERFEHYSYLAGGAATNLSIPVSVLMPDVYQVGVATGVTAVLEARSPSLSRVLPEEISVPGNGQVEVVVMGQNLQQLKTSQVSVVPDGDLKATVKAGTGNEAWIVLLEQKGDKERTAKTKGYALQFSPQNSLAPPLISMPLTLTLAAYTPPPAPAPATPAPTPGPAEPDGANNGGGGDDAVKKTAVIPAPPIEGGPVAAPVTEKALRLLSDIRADLPRKDPLDDALLLLPRAINEPASTGH